MRTNSDNKFIHTLEGIEIPNLGSVELTALIKADPQKLLRLIDYSAISRTVIMELKKELFTFFRKILPDKTDPIKQADNLNAALREIAQGNPSFFNDNTLKKIFLIDDLLNRVYTLEDPEVSYFSYLMNELYQGIDTIKHELNEKRIKAIETSMASYRLALENANKKSEIYKNKENLLSLKRIEANVLLAKKEKNQPYDPESFIESIQAISNVINNLNLLQAKADSLAKDNPFKSSASLVCTEGYKLAYQLTKGKRIEDLNFLAKSIQDTKNVVDHPGDTTAIEALSNNLKKAEKKNGFKKFVLSIAAIVVGSLMVLAGATIILCSVFAKVTLPTIIGSVLGMTGVVGGIALTASGTALAASGLSGVSIFKTAPTEKKLTKAQRELMSTTQAKLPHRK